MGSSSAPLPCGCPTPMAFARKDTGEMIVSACKMWRCPHCGPKRRAELSLRTRMAVNIIVRRRKQAVQFLTLTLDPKRNMASRMNGTKYQARYVSRCWRRLICVIRERCRRAGLQAPWYLKVAEWREKTDAMHLHILLVGWLPSTEGLRADIVAAGFGRVFDIQRVESVKRVARYLTKYVAKTAEDRAPPYVHRYSYSRGGLPPLPLWKGMVANGYLPLFRDEDSRISQSAEIWWQGEIREAIEAHLAQLQRQLGRNVEGVEWVCLGFLDSPP